MVIVGGGFGGLYAARALGKAPVEVTVVDRTNHHVFQPLLYQVATASLSPSQIAYPIRGVLRHQKNTRVLLADVVAVDPARRVVKLSDGELAYDWLILAPGARHSYFGHAEWEPFAPGLKTLDDALEIRSRILVAFERAERESDPERRRALLTFVVVGGGPAGVELAGAIGDRLQGDGARLPEHRHAGRPDHSRRGRTADPPGLPRRSVGEGGAVAGAAVRRGADRRGGDADGERRRLAR